MGQGEVLRVLEKSKKPLGLTQIAKILDSNPTGVARNLRCLKRNNEIKTIELDCMEARYYIGSPKLKRRTVVFCDKEIDNELILVILNEVLRPVGINIRSLRNKML